MRRPPTDLRAANGKEAGQAKGATPAPSASPAAAAPSSELASPVTGGHHHVGKKKVLSLSLMALGIVYGDIGTSPLYSMRECFHGSHALPVNSANIFGILSLIFWSLVVVVALKYHVYVIRLDNRGEGGILALMGLVKMNGARRAAVQTALIAMGVFGAALL